MNRVGSFWWKTVLGKTQFVFHGRDTIAGHDEFGGFVLFQADEQPSAEPGVDLVDPMQIDEGGTVNADELFGVELLLQFRDGRLDDKGMG